MAELPEVFRIEDVERDGRPASPRMSPPLVCLTWAALSLWLVAIVGFLAWTLNSFGVIGHPRSARVTYARHDGHSYVVMHFGEVSSELHNPECRHESSAPK